MKKKPVAIVMGSDSDLPIMQETAKILDEFKVGYEMTIASAHRSPELTAAFAKNASQKGHEVIIAGAGSAAHLAGVIASKTTLPVIGVPIDSSSLMRGKFYLSFSLHSRDHETNYHRLDNMHSIWITSDTRQEGFVNLASDWEVG